MNERIRKVREHFGLTLQEFGTRINFSAGLVSNMETKRRAITERAQKLICAEFNVNSEWLKTGEGEMLLPYKDDPVGAFCKEHNIGGVIRNLLTVYFRLSDDGKESVENYFDEVFSMWIEEKENTLSVSEEEYVEEAVKRAAQRAKEEALREYKQVRELFKGDFALELLQKAE